MQKENLLRISSPSILCGILLVAVCIGYLGLHAHALMRSGRYSPFFDTSHPNAVQTRKYAESLIIAIEKWRAEQGEYPATLELLSPRYMAKNAPPLYGDGKWYYTTSSIGFTLRYQADGGYPSCTYASDTMRWNTDN